MPVESEQAQAARPGSAQPPPGESVAESRVAAPCPPHDEHELPDGRYLIAYRSAPNA